TTPAEVWPSPQVMLAVKSSTVPAGSESVKKATTPVKTTPAVAATVVPAAVSAASGPVSTVTVAWAVVLAPSLSTMATLTVDAPPLGFRAQPPRPSHHRR